MSIALPPVLIVDDEKNMRQTLTTLLQDEDYEARAVDSAEEALRLLAHDEFLMVITDARRQQEAITGSAHAAQQLKGLIERVHEERGQAKCMQTPHQIVSVTGQAHDRGG